MSNKGNSRDKILEAATRLFKLQGYHATGLKQILKESGAPAGSLYYHFPNGKEQLAIEALTELSNRMQTYTQDKLALFSNPVEAFQHLIEEIAKELESVEDLQDFSIGLFPAETSLKDEHLRKACQIAFEGLEAIYAKKLIENGFNEEQAIRLSIVINSMIEGCIIRSLTNKNGQPLFYLAEHVPLLLKR